MKDRCSVGLTEESNFPQLPYVNELYLFYFPMLERNTREGEGRQVFTFLLGGEGDVVSSDE